ncbi:hypothetical protein BLTE_06120 [Blastochloris tepida]|uniref:Alginate O-acetyltransferase n=1 Tax=Blastochloris tepida TaxID=2233851 RepID=A0A348FX94_9HYPH|nr:hypothetical protein BLTE_06120 [Blastochloris tepida]
MAFLSNDISPFIIKTLYSTLIVLGVLHPLLLVLMRFGNLAVAPYLLFFAISATSFLGVTETMTGFHVISSNPAVYGLSFYGASLAYHVHLRSLTVSTAVTSVNPLLLFTGPIATTAGRFRYATLQRRFLHYFPYALIGFFFFKIVGAPLGNFFWMIDDTNIWKSLQFAAIFEMFVYFNFAGLSLMVYAACGLIGLKVPLNFQQPFSARNIIEFWRGWHISLSTVLKALFYTPARQAFGGTAALFLVYLSSALWHGVALNFLIWGLFHAVCFWLTIRLLKADRRLMTTILMVFAIVYGRMLFVDSDTERLLAKMTFDSTFPAHIAEAKIPVIAYISLLLASTLVFMEFALARQRLFRQRTYKYLRTNVSQILILAATILLIQSDGGASYAVYGQR